MRAAEADRPSSRSLTAMMTPGHSPGCTSWSMTVRENGKDYRVIIFCSGTVALNGASITPTDAAAGSVKTTRGTAS